MASLMAQETFRSPFASIETNNKRGFPLKKAPGPLDSARRDFVPPSVDRKLLTDDRSLNALFTMEDSSRKRDSVPKDYFRLGIQHEMTPHMRDMVTEWMLEVCTEENADSEVYPLAVSLLDRFLSEVDIFPKQLQALATACLFTASKVKLPQPFCSRKLSSYTDSSASVGQIMSWELLLLSRLDWDVSRPTPFDFLERLLCRFCLSPILTNVIREDCRNLFQKIAREFQLAIMPSSIQAFMCVLASIAQHAPEATPHVHKWIQKYTGIDTGLLQQFVDVVNARCFLPESPTPFMFVGDEQPM